MVRKVVIVFICAFFCAEVAAQSTNFTDSRKDWRRSKQELILGYGYNNFLGDLGGLDGAGIDYSIADIDWPLTLKSPTVMGAYRMRLTKKWAYRAMFTYARIQGSDQQTGNLFRNYRNLHFRSNIFELSQCIEFGYSIDRVGKRYNIPGLNGFKNKSTYLYVYGGIGALYFNPKAQHNEGGWVALQPLGTEGQLVSDTLRQYRRITATIPFGGGVRFLITKRLNIGVEVSYRKVFSDYLDDVSGDYYNNDVIRSVSGDVAADLADPSSGLNPNWTIQGETKRGPNHQGCHLICTCNDLL